MRLLTVLFVRLYSDSIAEKRLRNVTKSVTVHSGVSSGSLAWESEGLFPQTLHVAHGWHPEEAFVLSVEVGGVVVAHAVQHQALAGVEAGGLPEDVGAFEIARDSSQ